MAAPRPAFSVMWAHFSTIYGDGKVTTVGDRIGGKVKANIDLGVKEPSLGFTNACALRMSYSLNYSGTIVTRGNWKTVSGADKKWYIYRVRDLIQFLTEVLGRPDRVVKNPGLNDFNGQKGILVFDVDWSDATGHVTLWNGSTCSDHCFFPVASEASIWHLD